MEIIVMKLTVFMDIIHIIIPNNGIFILTLFVLFLRILPSFLCSFKEILEEILMTSAYSPSICRFSVKKKFD